MSGVKHDENKPDYSLLNPNAIGDLVRVLTFGNAKYSRDNWKLLEDSYNRYFAAAQRHLWAMHNGELNDPESGLPHVSHAMACLMFIHFFTNNET